MSETLHIYTRVSSSAQEEDGTSLETQKELGIKKAKELGMKPQVWNEGGQSSRHDDLSNRPVLADILRAIEAENIKHLWIFNTDRLSRNETTWGMIRLRLVQHQVTLHTPSGIFLLSNPTDKLLLGILSEFSSFDNSQRAERSRIGKIKRISQGFWMGGPPPYGYKVEGKRLVAHADERKWIKYIFQSYRDGKTIREIRKHLMENGVKTRRNNRVWSLGSIEALFRNTHYAGYFVVRDKKAGDNIRCECEAILTPTLYHDVSLARKQRSERRIRESNQKHFYLLRDFLVCEHCGSRMCGRTYPKQYRSVYYCPRKERNYANFGTDREKKCSNSRYLKIAETDDLVWETIVKILTTSFLFKSRSFMKTSDEDKEIKVETSILQKQLKGLDGEIKDIGDSLLNLESDRIIKRRSPDEVERIIKDVEGHRTALRAKREKLLSTIHSEKSARNMSQWLSEFGESIGEMKELKGEKRKELLDLVVSTIQVKTLGTRSHRLTIKFKLQYCGGGVRPIDPQNRSKGVIFFPGSDTFTLTHTDAKKKPENSSHQRR